MVETSEPGVQNRAVGARRGAVRASQDAAEALRKLHQPRDPRAREPGLALPSAFVRGAPAGIPDGAYATLDLVGEERWDGDLIAALAAPARRWPRRPITEDVRQLLPRFDQAARAVKRWQTGLHPQQRPAGRSELRPVSGDLAAPRWAESEARALERRVRWVCYLADLLAAGVLVVRPATLGILLRRCRRDGVPLKTYVTVAWLAAERGDATLHDISLGDVCHVIGLPDTSGDRRRVRATLSTLESLALVAIEPKPPAPPDVTLLHPDRSGQPPPAPSVMPELLPAGLFTRGWCARLNAPALAAALVLADQHPPTDDDQDPLGTAYPAAAGISDASWYRGLDELHQHQLIETVPAPANPRTGSNAFRRHRYRLLRQNISGNTAPNSSPRGTRSALGVTRR